MRYLLLIDSGGDVVLADIDNGVRMPIGGRLLPEQQSRVLSAVWSPVGEWTAWAVNSESPDGVRELRLHIEETDETSVLAESVSAFYLCPSPCGRWLSHLSLGPLGLELAVSEVLTGEVLVVERGQPLFWSWSPDASSIALHVEDRVLIAGLDGEPPRLLTGDAGPFIAPWWLPGGSVAYSLEDRIVSTGPDDEVNMLVENGSSGRFAPDPDGRRLAYVEWAEGEAHLVVLDLLSRERNTVTSDPVAGFFWSPDGSRLAALTAGDGDGELRWCISDGSQARPLPPFRPSRTWAATVLPFFEQYAQSHSHWSDDGSKVVAPAIDDDGTSGALIQAVDAPNEQQWVPDADLACWA